MARVDGHDDRPGSPPWVWAALVALALATLTVGAIVGMVTTDDRDGSNASSGTDAAAAPAEAGTSVPATPTDVLPPTVSVPPATEAPADTGFTIPPDTSTVPGTTTEPSSAGTWPAGQPGYTVILASVAEAQGRSEADNVAQRATAAGLPQVGVLRSADFPSLRPGWWVVYSGVYGTEAEARAALPQAQAAGFPSAYPRRVAP